MVHMVPTWSPHGVHRDSTGTLYMNLAELPAKESPRRLQNSVGTPRGVQGNSMGEGKVLHHMIPHMIHTLLLLLFFFHLKDMYLYSSTSMFFFPLRCKSSLLFSLYLWLILSSTVILSILGTYYQLISVFLSTEVTIILSILVYHSLCCAQRNYIFLQNYSLILSNNE